MAASIDLALLERIAEERRFEPRTLEIAKRMFIHGESLKRLSAEYGLHLQRIYAIRREIVAAAEASAVPPGWEQWTIKAPKAVMSEIKRQVAAVLAKNGVEEP